MLPTSRAAVVLLACMYLAACTRAACQAAARSTDGAAHTACHNWHYKHDNNTPCRFTKPDSNQPKIQILRAGAELGNRTADEIQQELRAAGLIGEPVSEADAGISWAGNSSNTASTIEHNEAVKIE